MAAASRVAEAHGYAPVDPVVLQRTNNTLVWLRPSAVVAKVATRAANHEPLTREHEIATTLVSAGADLAPPLAEPTRDRESGFLVTLWRRLAHDPDRAPAPAELGTSLRRLHESLAAYDGELPSCRAGLARANAVLADRRVHETLSADEISLLQEALERGRAALDARDLVEQPLHGEPHRGNLLVTRRGLRWIDFEDACRGPLEWDLAFLPAEAIGVFDDVDGELLALLRTLTSARVATWCSLHADHDELRWHREHHLARVRADAARR